MEEFAFTIEYNVTSYKRSLSIESPIVDEDLSRELYLVKDLEPGFPTFPVGMSEQNGVGFSK